MPIKVTCTNKSSATIKRLGFAWESGETADIEVEGQKQLTTLRSTLGLEVTTYSSKVESSITDEPPLGSKRKAKKKKGETKIEE